MMFEPDGVSGSVKGWCGVAQLAIANSFMPQYAKLEPKVRKGVEAAIAKFGEHTHAGCIWRS